MTKDFMRFLFNISIPRNRNIQFLLPQIIQNANNYISQFGNKSTINYMFAWGRKRYWRARLYRFLFNRQIIFLEDGFIRSINMTKDTPSLSVMADPVGVYYDATAPSIIENDLNSPYFHVNQNEIKLANKAIDLIAKHHISKYNQSPDLPRSYFPVNLEKILIVDQVQKDLSIKYGLAAHISLDQMITQARRDHPEAIIIIKPHPVNIKHGRLQHLDNIKNITLLKDDYNMISVLKQVDQVYVMTSQVGFEALLLNKQVTCFGIPFYAGWGCTTDTQQCARRITKRSILDIFITAYLRHSYYYNTESENHCNIIEAIEYICRQKATL